jgi:glyoxylase-like metal-dependent hydrolase (beta-lactamase superfamily II)/ferredoxin
MANRARAVPENAPGSFFVDSTCIDCDTCRQLAPATFADHGEHSYVRVQPRNGEEERAAYRALVACPTASIGAANKSGVARAVSDFPMQLAPEVFYCGFNSEKSFGGNSYFVPHPAGNWLVDSPRYVERLACEFEARGGIRHIFLTHRDDVADAAKWAARFHAERIIHRLELTAQPGAERVIDGTDPIALAPEFRVIPTPGHTAGHCVLLFDSRFLFTGDHLWWSRDRGRLTASREVCWFCWPQQIASLARLRDWSFEWVLPGHGERTRLPREEIRAQITNLVAAATFL